MNELDMVWVLDVATLNIAFNQKVAVEAKGILLRHWQYMRYKSNRRLAYCKTEAVDLVKKYFLSF